MVEQRGKMEKKGLNLDNPGWGRLRLKNGLFDLNGTLVLGGILAETVKKRLQDLQSTLAIYVTTADSHGTVADLLKDCGDLEIARSRRVMRPGKNVPC